MRRRGLLLGVLLVISTGVGAQFPEIRDLQAHRDPLFAQLQEAISLFHQRNQQDKEIPEVSLFQYRVKTGDTVFTLAARTGLSYDTLVSLNDLSNPASLKIGQWILIPTIPGLYVNQTQPGITELMGNWRAGSQEPLNLRIPTSRGMQTYLLFPGEQLHPIERAFFLGILFRMPLPKARMTSRFGPRAHPFSGHPSYHNGIDLAAPEGTEVFAAREGKVISTGFDRVYGNFVLLGHEGGYETLYGHMKQVQVSLNQSVELGRIVGKVGSTGLSTGPHLHFEIRRQGSPKDPVPLLPGRDWK